jgi:hypothetical protein
MDVQEDCEICERVEEEGRRKETSKETNRGSSGAMSEQRR